MEGWRPPPVDANPDHGPFAYRNISLPVAIAGWTLVLYVVAAVGLAGLLRRQRMAHVRNPRVLTGWLIPTHSGTDAVLGNDQSPLAQATARDG